MSITYSTTLVKVSLCDNYIAFHHVGNKHVPVTSVFGQILNENNS